jgi:hypothetical protein
VVTSGIPYGSRPRRAAAVSLSALREILGVLLIIAGAGGAIAALAVTGHGLAAVLLGCACAVVAGAALAMEW